MLILNYTTSRNLQIITNSIVVYAAESFTLEFEIFFCVSFSVIPFTNFNRDTNWAWMELNFNAFLGDDGEVERIALLPNDKTNTGKCNLVKYLLSLR